MSTRRIVRKTLTYGIIFFLIMGALCVDAFINREYTLQEVLNACSNVLWGTVESVDKKQMRAVVFKKENLKGESEFQRIQINIATGEGKFPEKLMPKFQVGSPMILFYNRRGAKIEGLGYIWGAWAMFVAETNKDSDVWWQFVRLAPFLQRTYNGSTADFRQLLFHQLKASSDWATFRGNVARTGNLDGTEAPKTVQLRWSFRDSEYPAPFASSPAVVGNRLYVGCDNDTIYCLDADKGAMVWKFDTNYEVFSSPAVAYDRVYVGEGLHYAEKAHLYCLDVEMGKLLWKFQTQGQVESSPVVADGRVYFGAGEDGVYCLDAFSGERIWHFSGGDVDTAPLVLSGKVSRIFFGTGRGDSRIYCLDARTGKELWGVDTPYPAWGPPAYYEGKLYFGIGNGTFGHSADSPAGQMLCLDAATGYILWRYEAQDSVNTATAVVHGKAYFGSRDGFLYCVNAGDGKLVWKFPVDAPVLSSPAVTGTSVIFGANNGTLNCLDAEKGEMRWSFDLGSGTFLMDMEDETLSSPAIANGRVYVGSSNMTFYCLQANSSGRKSDQN